MVHDEDEWYDAWHECRHDEVGGRKGGGGTRPCGDDDDDDADDDDDDDMVLQLHDYDSKASSWSKAISLGLSSWGAAATADPSSSSSPSHQQHPILSEPVDDQR